MQDVVRRATFAKREDRAARLRAGGRPEGDDFVFFAAHVGGRLQVFRPNLAAEPTTYGDGPLKLAMRMRKHAGAV